MQPTLTVNLGAIAENYRRLKMQFSGDDMAAVVKANAYGLGALETSVALIKEGCRRLFVATVEEAVDLKSHLVQHVTAENLPTIAVFHGPHKGQEETFIEHELVPVINHINQLERWMIKSEPASNADYYLHIDTGMNRLGLSTSDMDWLVQHGEQRLSRKPALLMSHLACANQKEHPKNMEQLEAFTAAQQYFSGVPTSFCNSSGIYLDRIFHGTMGRPGSALYGINPAPWLSENPMQHVADLTAPILMIRTLAGEETVGYGATATLDAGSNVAIIQMGYADGYLRYLSNKGTVYVGSIACPVVGRVSMDMIAIDVSHLPENELHHHKEIQIICKAQPVDALAHQADTIGYEVFTSLGDRVKRVYI